MLKSFLNLNQIYYCSKECQDKDIIYHAEICEKAIEIDETDIKFNENSKFGLVGLKNLGNTCFMNSAL